MKQAYEGRVHAVMDHVRHNLADELSLRELARVAQFSPHHFHRIFAATTGETLAQFTRRARLERAVFLMRASPHRTLTSIAAEVGFTTPSEFSRVFRGQYGVAPSTWDRRSRLDGKPDFGPAESFGSADRCGEGLTARLVERPRIQVAYVRVRDPWRGDHLATGYDHLRSWLDERDLPWRDRPLIGATWESGKATKVDRLVYDLGIGVAPDVVADGEVGIHVFSAARAVEVHCRSLQETASAWDYLYGTWLAGSGYEPSDLPALKRFRRTPAKLDAESWDVDCSIALRSRRG